MGRKKRTEFGNSLIKNMQSYNQYYSILKQLAISSFKWLNIPDTVDPFFLENTLFYNGVSVFFFDDVLGYLALETMISGNFDVYNIPLERRAYATNGYQKNLDKSDSVLIYNNVVHTNSQLDINLFAERLYNIDRIIDVNVNAQKTPVLIICDEDELLSMENIYMKYDGNQPVIYGKKSLCIENIKSINTHAEFVSDKLYELKTRIWNEALTYLGISNVSFVKKERMVTDEVNRSLGGVFSNRASRLLQRKLACSQINEMFGLDIDVEFNDFEQLASDKIGVYANE